VVRPRRRPVKPLRDSPVARARSIFDRPRRARQPLRDARLALMSQRGSACGCWIDAASPDQLVVGDEFDRVFQQSAIGGTRHRFVGAGRADVGELLALDGIDHEIVVAVWMPITMPS
jgi:hypothetical protein